jgi:hypothetical protein
MNAIEQRIVVAEACDWSCDKDGNWSKEGRYASENGCPLDYPRDLNAMHEAEPFLTKEQRNTYLIWLAKLTGCNPTFSTAGQRCEAFLKTIGKWKD